MYGNQNKAESILRDYNEDINGSVLEYLENKMDETPDAYEEVLEDD